MKTRLLIILTIVTVTIVSLLASDQYYLSLQDKELKKSDWIQNCVPVGPNEFIPLIGLSNHTHSFDLQTCSWNPTKHGTPGFLEFLYISFIESIFLDAADILEVQYAYAVLSPLKGQIMDGSDPDHYVCWNFTQLLIERSNGKFACVSPYTMMKLEWQPYKYEYYNIDVHKGNTVYAVFAHHTSESSGIVSGIRYDANSESIIVDMPRTNPGKLFIEIPRELLDANLVRCGEVIKDPSDWYFLVLVDGEEVEYEEVFTTDNHRTLEISYEKDLTQIEIAAPCII